MEDTRPGESNPERIERCSGRPYNNNFASQCRYSYGGQAGGTLVSRYPFAATEYHQFTPPASTLQPGLFNWGITYGKIQTPLGPVHLFCGSHATSESGMDPGVAQPLNETQSEDLLNYIKSKANGEPAIYLANTGSGPAVTASPTGPANAQWPTNFSVLQTQLTDALLSASACTYGCGGTTPDLASYVDHIMTSGKGTNPQGYSAGLCETNGGTLFTSASVVENGGNVPLSTHFGVRTDVHLAAYHFTGFNAIAGAPALNRLTRV